jgi:hypothetical protein
MDRSGRAVSMTKGALRRAIRSGAPGFVAHGANPSNAVGELLPGRGREGGQTRLDESRLDEEAVTGVVGGFDGVGRGSDGLSRI